MTIRERAETLYFQSNFTQKQIAEILNVTEQSVSKWAQSGKWAEKRAADIRIQKKTEARLSRILDHQLAIMEDHVDQVLAGKIEKTPLNKDDIAVLVKLIGMSHKNDPFAVVLSCQNEYMSFMKAHYPEQAQAISMANQQFIAKKLNDYQG